MIAKEMEYNATLSKQLTPDAIRFGLKNPNVQARDFFNYQTRPTEMRARAFEEIMTGRPNSNNRKGI